jgi:DNA polymerase iota
VLLTHVCSCQVFLDVSDMVQYNIELLNHNNLSASFFYMDQNDLTLGFPYDASELVGFTYPVRLDPVADQDLSLYQRLILGAHLAKYLRRELENEKGYTATVGISTNKLLSKLVGNLHKPESQTTLLPPYDLRPGSESNVISFMDAHKIGKVPGIGCKISQKIRTRIRPCHPVLHEASLYEGTEDAVTVEEVRTFPGMSPEMLEDILSCPGSQRGIGGKIWGLLHGVDETPVHQAKKLPSQISIEDSYTRLDTLEDVDRQLNLLSTSLLKRMHLDLMEDDPEASDPSHRPKKRWLAHPRTLRLTTRPRLTLNPDGTRSRLHNRVSRSIPMPTFAFSLTENNVHALAARLVQDSLMPVFRKLHPERSGWNLSLLNVAVTNLAETAAESRDSQGRDIKRMLRHQDERLREWRVVDHDVAPPALNEQNSLPLVEGAVGADNASDATPPDPWESDEEDEAEEVEDAIHVCKRCGLSVPTFALVAHDRFHDLPD